MKWLNLMAKQRIDPKLILKTSALFGDLDDQFLDKLTASLQTMSIKKNRILFSQGDDVNGCYMILDGTMKVSIMESDGEESLLAVLGRGDIVGEMGVIFDNKRSATATALKDATLGYLSINNFERLANAHPQIYRNLLIIVCRRLKETNQNFVNQQLALNERLARTLLNLSETFGEMLPDGRLCIRHKLTQVLLGRMTNASRENVNRQLSLWRDDKILSQISGYYCLHDLPVWKKLARLDLYDETKA